MKEMKKRYLQLPQGTEGVHLEEAYRHRQIHTEIFRLFTLWGYLPVETPVFDFYDIYRPLLHGNSNSIYRLIDREGDLLLLRSDITLFLAKQMGLWLREEDLPARVCYGDTILRHQHPEDISKNEFFQMGAELMGKAGFEADVEILLLLKKTFTQLGLSPALHIGSQQFLHKVLKVLPESEFYAAVEELHNRDFDAIGSILEKHLPKNELETIIKVIGFIGEKEEFAGFIEEEGKKLKEEEREELRYLLRIVELLEKLGRGENVRIDLSEVGGQPYYTGIVFRAYLPGLDSESASGGRYDKLLASFGFDCPSVGFSLMLRKIEDMVEDRFGLPEDITEVKQKDFTKAVEQAEKLREQGRIAIL